jgi:Glycosyl hydrolase family 26
MREGRRTPTRVRAGGTTRRARLTAICIGAACVLVACGPTRLAGDTGQVDTQVSAQPILQPLKGAGRDVPIPPDGNAYFGAQLDWSSDSPAAYTARLGRSAAIYGRFISFPLRQSDTNVLKLEVAQIAQQHAMFFLTLEPVDGLQTVTSQTATALADTLATWNEEGVDVFVRFGQEMNGSWYPWGQRPTEYIRAFRMIADAVHRIALKSVMVWSPNYAGGYPFLNELYNAKPTDADFQVMDTNHDGKLTTYDDAYTPYYPGDDAVDWVGLTLYNWGCHFPWGPNIAAESNKFVEQVTGTYNGLCGNESMDGNFYQEFAVGHNKPMALSETAAFYDEANAGQGSTNLQVKQDWMSQVLDPSLSRTFPLLKIENWFEYRQKENGVVGIVDWRATRDPEVLASLTGYLGERFILAPIAQ